MALVGKQFPNITVDAISEMGDDLRINILEEATKKQQKSIIILVPKRFYFCLPYRITRFPSSFTGIRKKKYSCNWCVL